MIRPQAPCGSRKRFALRSLLCSCVVWGTDSMPVLRSETSPVRNGCGHELDRSSAGPRVAAAAWPRRLPPVTNRTPASDSVRSSGELAPAPAAPWLLPAVDGRLVSTPTDIARLNFPSSPVKGFELPAAVAPGAPEFQPLLLPSILESDEPEPMTRLYPPNPKLTPIPTGHEISIPNLRDADDQKAVSPEQPGLLWRWQGSYLRDPLRRFPLRLPRP